MGDETRAVWVEAARINSYDADFQLRASVEAICRLFLEAAWNHAEALGFGHSHLLRHNKLWVLYRWLIRFESFPEWGQKLKIRTWPRPVRAVTAMREFELLDEAGRVLAASSSAWLVIDASSRKPVRADQFITADYELREDRALDRDAARLSAWPEPGAVREAAIRYSDVDVNGHTNSARLIGMLVDCCPEPLLQTHEMAALEVNYLAETGMGDVLAVRCARLGEMEQQWSAIKGDRSEALRANVLWRRRAP